MVLWGTRNPKTGNIDTVTEAQVLGIGNPHDSVHVFFDAGMRPVLLRDDATRYSLAVAYDSSAQRRFTFCNPELVALAQTTVVKTPSGWQARPATGGGSCRAVRSSKARAPTAGEFPCKDPTSFRCQMYVIGLLALVAGAQLAYYVPLIPLMLFLSAALDPRIPRAATAIDVSASIVAEPSAYRFDGTALKAAHPVAGTDGVPPRYESAPQH
ncbi:MAG TPA: hypothetical protein VFE36_07395 [Candidatus Baltobacteraceae bacterium]|nr:hypothetical protein [Candidatus Baltobacteraceae bacterium]